MKIKYSSIIPFKGFYAINLFGVMFVRKEFKDSNPPDKYDINHVEIHNTQAKDFCKILWLGYCVYYIIYFIFWLIELIRPPYNSAYRDNCFEKEAYYNGRNLDYLTTREKWSVFKKEYWINH